MKKELCKIIQSVGTMQNSFIKLHKDMPLVLKLFTELRFLKNSMYLHLKFHVL